MYYQSFVFVSLSLTTNNNCSPSLSTLPLCLSPLCLSASPPILVHNRNGLGLLSVTAFRPILECSVGRITDAQFQALLADSRQLSLPTHVDYRLFFDSATPASASTKSIMQQALQVLHSINLTVLCASDGKHKYYEC